jgi:hypothetical protein
MCAIVSEFLGKTEGEIYTLALVAFNGALRRWADFVTDANRLDGDGDGVERFLRPCTLSSACGRPWGVTG